MEYTVSTELWEHRENIFTYHKPFGDQPERYSKIRSKLSEVAHLLDEVCPSGTRELAIAMTKLEEVGFFANASIARNEIEETELGEE